MRRFLWLLVVVAAGCAPQAETPPKTTATPPPANEEVPTRPNPTAEPANLSAALSLAGLPIYPDVAAQGSGFAIAPGPNDNTQRLHATFSIKGGADKVMKFYTGKGLASTGGKGKQIAGKTENGSDVIMTFKPEGDVTYVEVRAILYGNSR